jgi:hypothetical protein
LTVTARAGSFAEKGPGAETTGNQRAATQLNQSYSEIYYATDLVAEDVAVNLLAAAYAMDATAPSTLAWTA